MSASLVKEIARKVSCQKNLHLLCKSDELIIIELIFNEILNEVFEIINVTKPQLFFPLSSIKISQYSPKKLTNSHVNKKKIGNYYYYLNDCIGNGYSSQVFKGYQNNNKNIIYAIKVIKLSKMTQDNRHLLKNQIEILQQLNHPNIIKLYQAFYSENHCYIITDYCEGGTLQNFLQSNDHIDWQQIFYQLLDACQYLQQKLIIHRDIKPTNIFKKGNKWKIGDFGFARFIPYKFAQIKEVFMIGSPLYMPPQTLENNIYSLKTDSFAFGILFYNLITKQYPWYGMNNRQIIQNYTCKPYPIEKIKHLPQHFQVYFQGLCQINIIQRFFISDYERAKRILFHYSVANPQTSTSSCLDLMVQMVNQVILDNVGKLKLCKFIYYIDVNIQHFPQMDQISQHIRRLLKFFLRSFGWSEKASHLQFIDQFGCENYLEFTTIDEFFYFSSLLQISIHNLDGSLIRRCQILRIKLMQLLSIIHMIMEKNSEQLKKQIHQLVLHSDFSKVLFFPSQVKEIKITSQTSE